MPPKSRQCSSVFTTSIVLISLVHTLFCHDYDNNEEELFQPNLIDEANSKFVCNSDGYFADVTYGCQYYHVCEIANNPYDKPSYVKHTFSCVNGTVFNQMSFTCTRYEDSIPCEASPNYFYLNKRNGDPKAHFLTDEDIVKTTHTAKNSFPLINNLIGERTLAYKENYQPKHNIHSRNNVRQSVASKQSVSPSIKYVEVKDPNELNTNSLLNSYNDNSYNDKSRAPYEMNERYFSNIKPGVRYSNQAKISNYDDFETKYEPKQIFSYAGPIQTDRSALMPKYQSLIRSQEFINSKIDQLLVNDDRALDEKAKTTYEFPKPKMQQINKQQTMKKSTFTPATFSKMYIENQKAKYNQHTPRYNQITAYKNNSYETIMRPTKYQHLRQDISNSKIPVYSEVSSQPFPKHKLPSNYYDKSKYEEIKSNQYIVPSSIRIIEPNENILKEPKKQENIRLAPVNDERDQNQNEPVKISFVNKNNDESSVNDYQDYKLVKQVKGKNLLIDPSLENDPARDNIIAQVLEMLSKYN